MRRIVKIIKDNILGFIIGAILFGGIGTVVATTILSSSVSYTNNNQTTVEGALNELYSKASRLDSWIDPRGLNVNGTGGKITFVYWNDNFSNDGPMYTNSQVPNGSGLRGTFLTREALAAAYDAAYNGEDQNAYHFADNPVYIKTTIVNNNPTGHAACLWYNNREFCLNPNSFDTDWNTTKQKLKNDIEAALSITIDITNCNYQDGNNASYVECTWGENLYYSCSVHKYEVGSQSQTEGYHAYCGTEDWFAQVTGTGEGLCW